MNLSVETPQIGTTAAHPPLAAPVNHPPSLPGRAPLTRRPMTLPADPPKLAPGAPPPAGAAAVNHARSLGITINAAVTDGSGTLMAFLRMNGAFLHSIDIALD